MYYVEKIINGVLHYKNLPSSPWVMFSPKKLTTRITELESRLLDAHNKLIEQEQIKK